MRKQFLFTIFLTFCFVCSSAQAWLGGRKVVYLTKASGSPWTVPTDWNSTNNTIECIGAGGGGGTSTSGYTAGGGAGGGYSKISNYGGLSVGANVAFHVSAGAAAVTSGGDTWFCSANNNCATILGTAVIVGAKGGGAGAATNTTAAGGASAGGFGTVKFSGGNGGVESSGNPNGAAAGGGAAGHMVLVPMVLSEGVTLRLAKQIMPEPEEERLKTVPRVRGLLHRIII